MCGAGCNQTSTPINLCVFLPQVTQASKVWGEVPPPEDLKAEKVVQASQSLLDDDEDFAADAASGGELDGRPDGLEPAAALAAASDLRDVFLIPHSSDWAASRRESAAQTHMLERLL